jgi:hypothetical protein
VKFCTRGMSSVLTFRTSGTKAELNGSVWPVPNPLSIVTAVNG